MSHLVEKMMFHGETPWHNTNCVRIADQDLYDTEAGIELAGANWEAELDQLKLSSDGRPVDAWAIVRKTDRRVLCPSVGPDYRILQNRTAFKFFNPILEAKKARLHTAGVLDNGRIVWVLCQLMGQAMDVVKGDKVVRFALLSNYHGGGAVRVGFTTTRVVCANTIRAAHSSSASKLIRIRHTDSMERNLEAVRDVMDLSQAEFVADMEQYRKLASVHISQADVNKYVRLVLGVNEKLPLDEISGRTRNKLMGMIDLFEKGTGNNIPGVEGTLWAAYNGITEALSHSGSNANNRMKSLWYGTNAEVSKRAFDIALSMAS